MYLDIGWLSTQGQQQGRELGKLQRQLEQGESLLVEELDTFERALAILDQESKEIPAEIVGRVQAFQAQQTHQEEQAAHSQVQDEQLRDHILKEDEIWANDQANYKSELTWYKKQREEVKSACSQLPEILIQTLYYRSPLWMKLRQRGNKQPQSTRQCIVKEGSRNRMTYNGRCSILQNIIHVRKDQPNYILRANARASMYYWTQEPVVSC